MVTKSSCFLILLLTILGMITIIPPPLSNNAEEEDEDEQKRYENPDGGSPLYEDELEEDEKKYYKEVKQDRDQDQDQEKKKYDYDSYEEYNEIVDPICEDHGGKIHVGSGECIFDEPDPDSDRAKAIKFEKELEDRGLGADYTAEEEASWNQNPDEDNKDED